MRRRQVITLLSGAAAWPFAARARQPAMPAIGYLGGETFESSRDRIAAFHRGMGEAGYVEGRNVAIEYRWAEYHYDRLPVPTGLQRRSRHLPSARRPVAP
jgi:putative ABC transport system substrate-binding protein